MIDSAAGGTHVHRLGASRNWKLRYRSVHIPCAGRHRRSEPISIMTEMTANSAEIDDRTRAFFERNLQARTKLCRETNKQVEKRNKLREDFGADSNLFDSWRAEQEETLDMSSRNGSLTTASNVSGPTESLLATTIASVQISDNNVVESEDKVEKNEE